MQMQRIYSHHSNKNKEWNQHSEPARPKTAIILQLKLEPIELKQIQTQYWFRHSNATKYKNHNDILRYWSTSNHWNHNFLLEPSLPTQPADQISTLKEIQIQYRQDEDNFRNEKMKLFKL